MAEPMTESGVIAARKVGPTLAEVRGERVPLPPEDYARLKTMVEEQGGELISAVFNKDANKVEMEVNYLPTFHPEGVAPCHIQLCDDGSVI